MLSAKANEAGMIDSLRWGVGDAARFYGVPGDMIDGQRSPVRRPQVVRDVSRLQRLANVDVDAHDLAVKDTHETRKEAKRRLADREVRVKDFDPSIAGKELVDVTALNSKRDGLKQLDLTRKEIERDIEQNEQTSKGLHMSMENIDENIASLKKQLEAAEGRKTAKQLEIGANDAAKDSLLLKLGKALPADPAELLRIETEIASAGTVNLEIGKHKAMEADVRQLKDLRQVVENAEQAVKEAEQARVDAIASVPLPEGLKFTADGQDLLLNDLPLDQACKSELTILGIKLQAMHLGDLKYVSFEGGHLDHASLCKVVEWLQANGMQAAIEIADRSKEPLGLTIIVAEQYLA